MLGMTTCVLHSAFEYFIKVRRDYSSLFYFVAQNKYLAKNEYLH